MTNDKYQMTNFGVPAALNMNNKYHHLTFLIFNLSLLAEQVNA